MVNIMNKIAIFTVSSNNYYAFSLTLLKSVAEQHSNVDLFYFVADKPFHDVDYEFGENIKMYFVENILGAEVLKMAFKYNLIEFNTAIKPFLIRHLFNLGYEKVLYLDPDIFVYSPLDYAFEKLDHHSVVVTPHQLDPEPDVNNEKLIPKWEIAALMTGTFNLGFVGVSRSEEGQSFVRWWEERCRYFCLINSESGLFVDQKWVDLAPCFFPGLHIIRHAGYNMSAWNLCNRKLSGTYVNGRHPLVFYHFSSIDMQNDNVISKHDLSLDFESKKDLELIFREYKNRVKENCWDATKNIPYAYNYFSDGNPINYIHRSIYISVEEEMDNPFDIRFSEFFRITRRLYRESGKKNTKNIRLSRRIIIVIMKLIYHLIGFNMYNRIIVNSRRFSKIENHRYLFL